MQIKNIEKMRRINRSIISIIFLSLSMSAFSQESENISTKIYNLVYKNIIYHEILCSTDFDKSSLENFFDIARFFPDSGYYLDLDIQRLDWKFPLSKYAVYKVTKSGWTFTKTVLKNYNLDNKIEDDSSFSTQSISISTLDTYTTAFNEDVYLVAYDNKNDNIIFISGDFYTSSISSYFSLDINNPATFIPYLRYKLFNLDMNNVSFFKKKKTKLYFKIEYNNNENSGYVEIKNNNFERIKIYKKYPKSLFEKIDN